MKKKIFEYLFIFSEHSTGNYVALYKANPKLGYEYVESKMLRD